MTDWYIVGRGPSILTLTPADFGAGPVIALNRGIEQVRALGLPNPTYAMAKDGCAFVKGEAEPPGHACLLDIRPPEVALLSRRESINCVPRPGNVFIDVEGMGLPWYFQSAAVAVQWVILQGASRIFMYGHDAYVSGDTTRVEGDQLIDDHDAGYVETGQRAARIAADAGVELVWR